MNNLPHSEVLRYLRQITLPTIDDPHPTNRGVIDSTTPTVFSHLDYLAVRWDGPVNWGHSHMAIPGLDDLIHMTVSTNGVKNYRYGATCYPAGRFYWNDSNPEYPGYLVMAGTDLAILRDVRKISDDDLIKRIMRGAHGVTRLDFAINVTAGSPAQVLWEWKRKRVKTRVQNVDRIDRHGKKKGSTVYIGSPASERFVRVYDKLAELGQKAEFVLTRIEQQIGKEPAHRLATLMASHGVKNVGRASIKKFVDFPELDWWQLATEGPEMDIQLKPQKETSFEKWLMEQVYPAIEKRMAAGMEAEAIERFTRALMGLYGELDSGANKNSK